MYVLIYVFELRTCATQVTYIHVGISTALEARKKLSPRKGPNHGFSTCQKPSCKTWVISHVPIFHITQPLDSMIGIWPIMATIRWCPIFPKWDIYQPLVNLTIFLAIPKKIWVIGRKTDLYQSIACFNIADIIIAPIRDNCDSNWKIIWVCLKIG